MARKKPVEVAAPIVFDDGGYAAAERKAQDPAMLVKDNPLANRESCCGSNPALFHHNMERLHNDADMRRCPVHGSIYGAIMDNRYGG